MTLKNSASGGPMRLQTDKQGEPSGYRAKIRPFRLAERAHVRAGTFAGRAELLPSEYAAVQAG